MRRSHGPEVKGVNPDIAALDTAPCTPRGPSGPCRDPSVPATAPVPSGPAGALPTLDLSAGDCSGLARGSLSAAFPPSRAPEPWRPP